MSSHMTYDKSPITFHLNMITINTDKGLVRIDCWEDVLERPGFDGNLDPKLHVLASIIGRYLFGDKVPCGLSDCHTPHSRGYLVATKNGRETNIGKDCGKNFFGVDFKEMAKRFENDLAEKDNREYLWTVRSCLEDIEGQIVALKEGADGASWVNKTCSALQSPAKVPLQISRALLQLAKQKTGVLTAQREATEREVEDLEAIRGKRIPRPHYIEEAVAEIQGIEALYPENSLRDLIAVHLEENIKLFKNVDIDQVSLRELTRWSKWARTIEQTMEAATTAAGYGRVLLTRRNLAPLQKHVVIERTEDRERFAAFLVTLPA